MADPKADSDSLLNAALPFAQKMLKEHGEFYSLRIYPSAPMAPRQMVAG